MRETICLPAYVLMLRSDSVTACKEIQRAVKEFSIVLVCQ